MPGIARVGQDLATMGYVMAAASARRERLCYAAVPCLQFPQLLKSLLPASQLVSCLP